MNTRKSIQYTLNIKSPITNRAGLMLSASGNWEVHRVKELILQFHPESPPVSAQQLIYKGKNLANSTKLIDILSTDQEATIILHIDMNFRVLEADYSSKIFHAREKEYIDQYKIAMEFITSSLSYSSHSEVFDSKSVINSLPLMHSDTMKRIHKMCVPAPTQNKVKLRPISLQNYLDFLILFRAGLFLIIIFFFLGLSGVINLSLVMVLFYM
jgi:hypothetical protein